jgi:signal transduction histidine kinase
MLNISWRLKLFLFAMLFALLPIAVASLNMITITQDELKSNRNHELSVTTGELAEHINRLYGNNWLSPLLLIKSGVERDDLGANEKATFLSAGIDNIEDIAALTLYFEVKPGEYVKAVQTFKKSFKNRLEEISLDASQILDVPAAEINALKKRDNKISAPVYLPQLDTWLMTMIIPVEISGAPAGLLAARITLDNLRQHLRKHAFNKQGRIFLVDEAGTEIFSAPPENWQAQKVVQDATALLTSNSRAQAVTSFQTADGEHMLGAYDFPLHVPWAVIAEIPEGKAYLAVAKMRQTLLYWLLLGLALAILGVAIFSRQISRPIIKISQAADQIASGNFDVQVAYGAKDEIGVLAKSLTHMSQSLKESFAQIAAQKNELEEYSKTLEEKVETRTLELKEKNTALENTLAQLKQTQSQLIVQEKLASLGALTAGIAHEIKNPLNFVNNFAALTVDLAEELKTEVLQHHDKFDEKVSGNITEILGDIQLNATKIAEHGKRADGIIKGMLEHSRGDAGEMQATDVNKMVEDFVNLAYHGMRAQDPTFNIRIEKNLAPNLAPVKINPQAISRVIINICNNGFYATREKQKKNGAGYDPTVSLATADLGEKIEIRIRDNGTGIPAHVRDKIFNPFFSTKPTGTGTGLGLSISYEIITQMHKGELKVETEEGQYTEFIMRLPKNL